MSLPSNLITPSPATAAFLPPWDDAYTPLTERVQGGIAIGNPSGGRQVKNWVVTYTGGNIVVSPDGGAAELTLPMAGVTSVSLGFDSNMAATLAYQTSAGANLYYFNSITASYTTLTIAGATSCRCSVDDPRLFNAANSDVIFAYILGGVLYWRQQRDRYTTERTVGTATTGVLQRIGPTVAYRFQFLVQPP